MRITKEVLYYIFNEPSQAALLSFEAWEELLRVLRQEMLLGRFACLFLRFSGDIKNADIKKYVVKHLQNSVLLTKRQNESVEYEVTQLNKALKNIGSPVIYLKGTAYSLSSNAASLGRTYGDIDVLIDQSALPVAEQELMLHCWFANKMDDYDEKYYREWAHEIPPLSHASRGTILDLHHNLVPPISGRAPNISLFMQNLETVNDSFVFRPAAMVLHSIVHLFVNEDFKHGLRDISDISLLFNAHDTSDFWQDIIELAQQTNFMVELFLAFRYSQKIFRFKSKCEESKQINQQQFSRFKLRYWDFMFESALGPKHSLVKNKTDGFALFCAYIRGHSLKMPVKILVPHIITKSFRKIVELLAGKYFFSKEPEH